MAKKVETKKIDKQVQINKDINERLEKYNKRKEHDNR
jgi:hypothetical protein